MAVNKIDPKVIFASEAPAQDTPAVFTNRTVGWGETRKNGGRPTIKQMNAEQQSTDLKILWLNENAVTPYDVSIDYPEDAVTVKDGVFKIFDGSVWNLFLDKTDIGLGDVDNTSDLNKPVSTATQTALDLKADRGYVDNFLPHNNLIDRNSSGAHETDAIVNNSGETQQQINDRGGATWYAKSGGYALSARVILSNGDEVRSTVANNIINPNVNMSGWVLTKDVSQIVLANGLSQSDKNKDFVFVEDYYAKGGALRPVSDLYTVGSNIHQKRFKNFADVQAFFPHVTAETDPLDWAATQKAVNENSYVRMRGVHYYWGDKVVELPIDGLYFHGAGITTRIYTTGLKALKAKDGVRMVLGDYGHFYLVGNNTPNSIGFDTSAFSYCTFQNIWIRSYGDGWFADGSTSPVNKQYSNNTVINVRSNNNLDRGFRFVGSSEANSANTYIGCEGAGNIRGWDEVVGYSNQSVGCTFQGNSELDFYTDGQRNIYQFYTEGNPKSIKLGSLSRNNKIDIRSSYPLWNTCDDEGMENTKSVRGEISVDSHVFKNPYFENWISAVPINTLPNGAAAFSWFSDTNLSKGGGLQIVFNANFQGFILQGLDPKINYAGRWVTVQIEADTSGITDLTGLRIYTRDGSTNNGTSGEFAVSNWEKTTAGQYKNFTFDVKFPATIAGIPTILIYLAYDGITTTNTIRISATKVILGQKDRIGDYALSSKATSSAATNFTSATSGLNSAWKTPPRFIYNSTSGKMYYASGSSATSAWKALDGSADIVPI